MTVPFTQQSVLSLLRRLNVQVEPSQLLLRNVAAVIVTGFAHSGKTQLTNTMIVNNPDKKILFFSLDDPAEMILAKLVAMQTDVPASLLEDRIRDGDEDAAGRCNRMK